VLRSSSFRNIVGRDFDALKNTSCVDQTPEYYVPLFFDFSPEAKSCSFNPTDGAFISLTKLSLCGRWSHLRSTPGWASRQSMRQSQLEPAP
jgi:hypothetical protein